MLIVSLSVPPWPSVTVKRIPVKVLGPCTSVGVQLNVRVVALNVAPVGKPLALNVRVLPGRSASVPLITNVSTCPSSMVRFPIAPSTGSTLTSFTVIVMVSLSLNCGVPLSVTVIVRA